MFSPNLIFLKVVAGQDADADKLFLYGKKFYGKYTHAFEGIVPFAGISVEGFALIKEYNGYIKAARGKKEVQDMEKAFLKKLRAEKGIIGATYDEENKRKRRKTSQEEAPEEPLIEEDDEEDWFDGK